jgi:glycosyltransferase involved in cell wall biosynthesis
MRRVDELRHELRYGTEAALGGWKRSKLTKRKEQVLREWLRNLSVNPPDVLIGANVNSGDGIRNHLLGIRQYSALNVAFSPPDEVMSVLGYHDLHTTFREIVQAFEPRGIRAIHSHVYPYYIEWCRRHKGAGALWVHTYHLPYFRLDDSIPLEPWQEEVNSALVGEARHADVRLSVARWQQGFLESQHGITTRYVPNGVDVSLCDRGDPDGFARSPGERFVLFVGRNDPVKNPADFIRLAHRMPDEKFVMLGKGLTREAISALHGALCPANLFPLGEAARAEVQDALAACSAVVVTSIREGLPTVVLEAMAHSRPVVVSDDPGCVEAVADGKHGFVYRQGDLEDLVQQTRAALSDVERCAGARDYVLAEYDWRVVAPRLDSIYGGA